MIKKLLILFFISQFVYSCSIGGAYYLVNSSDKTISVRLGLDQVNVYMIESHFIKSEVYKGAKIYYDDYDKMIDHPYEIDSLSGSVVFTLEPNRYAFIGYGANNNSDVEILDIDQIQKPLRINEKDYEKVNIFPAKIGAYLGVITIDQVDVLDNIPPPNGEYVFDIAFAEWEGRSLGEEVKVVIKNRKVEIKYMGNSNLPIAKKDELLDSGILVRHKSGEWIIIQTQEEINADEIGGCTGGPAIIDFTNKKYIMC